MRNEIGNSYIAFSEDSDELIIDGLFVDPSTRGEKLGYKLLDIAKDYAYKNDLTMTLCAEPQSEGLDKCALIEYYREYGFESDANCDELMTY